MAMGTILRPAVTLDSLLSVINVFAGVDLQKSQKKTLLLFLQKKNNRKRRASPELEGQKNIYIAKEYNYEWKVSSENKTHRFWQFLYCTVCLVSQTMLHWQRKDT